MLEEPGDAPVVEMLDRCGVHGILGIAWVHPLLDPWRE